MNGGHDLGGMHGLGHIDPEPEQGEPCLLYTSAAADDQL